LERSKYIGRSFPLQDAKLKATGDLRYGNDLSFTAMVHARLVLSTVPHGIIEHIDTSRALVLPGVLAVFHVKNTPARRFSRYRVLPGQENTPEDEVLFPEKVRFAGDRVAAVAAADPETARKAADLITVTYRNLPAFVTPGKALAAEKATNGKTVVPVHSSGNLLYAHQNRIGYPPPFSPDDLVTETETRTPRIHHAAMETHGCTALYDGDKLTIYSGSQVVYGIRTVIADLLGMPYHKVRIIKVPVGGSFGGRQESIVEPVAAFMAVALKRPVKLTLDREQTIVATMTRPSTRTRIRSKLSAGGRIREVRADTLFNVGAYAGNALDYAGTISHCITRLYRVPCYRHRISCVYTNTPVTGGARGWGTPELFAAVETHFFQAAKALGMDPVDLHLKNVVRPGDIDPGKGLSLGNVAIRDCIEQGALAFDWRNRYARDPGSGRIRRGVGMACVAHKNGMRANGTSPEHTSMVMKMNEDGTCVLNTALQELGCGLCTAIGLIAAETLGISPEQIAVTEADTETSPYDFGTVGSRVTYNCGACAMETAGLLREKIMEAAARVFNVNIGDILAREGWAWPRGREGDKKPFSKIACLAKTFHDTDIVVSHTYHGLTNPGAYGAHFAEVSVDTLTGRVEVTDYLAVHDLGRIINRAMVEGQIQGCVQMGIGYALYEAVLINEDGTVANSTFRAYHMVNACAMPHIRMILLEKGGDGGPFGAKSIGEAGTVPVAPAVVNAVNHALRGMLSRPLHDLPLVPEKVIAALEEHPPVSPMESTDCSLRKRGQGRTNKMENPRKRTHIHDTHYPDRERTPLRRRGVTDPETA
jgi:CO/xanthine dehydrogenase Mo-binding subunit